MHSREVCTQMLRYAFRMVQEETDIQFAAHSSASSSPRAYSTQQLRVQEARISEGKQAFQ